MTKMLFSNSRLESLSDGIFGFAMTLLVANLAMKPDNNIPSNEALLSFYLSMSHEFYIYTISFFLLASLWGVHQRQFTYIKKNDSTLMWLNMARLFFVVLIPFTAEQAGIYSQLSVAMFVFSLNILLINVTSFSMWHYAMRNQLTTPIPSQVVMSGNKKNIYSIIISSFACVMSIFYPKETIWVFALMPLGLTFITHRNK